MGYLNTIVECDSSDEIEMHSLQDLESSNINQEQNLIQTDDTYQNHQGRTNNRYTEHEDHDYAANKNEAEGMMDVALLTANANQLRFLITYNSQASTYHISLFLVILSLVMQVSVGIALIFRSRWRRSNSNRERCALIDEFVVVGVYMVAVVNILLAAFTTTDGQT